MLDAITTPCVQGSAQGFAAFWQDRESQRHIIKVCLLNWREQGTTEVLHCLNTRKGHKNQLSASSNQLWMCKCMTWAFVSEAMAVTTKLCSFSCCQFRGLWSAGIPFQRGAPSWWHHWETEPWLLRLKVWGWPWPSRQPGPDTNKGVFSKGRLGVGIQAYLTPVAFVILFSIYYYTKLILGQFLDGV